MTAHFPRLMFDSGRTQGMQVNTIEPNPASGSSRDGQLVRSYDQLNPANLY